MEATCAGCRDGTARAVEKGLLRVSCDQRNSEAKQKKAVSFLIHRGETH
jgi:hypothetical protein